MSYALDVRYWATADPMTAVAITVYVLALAVSVWRVVARLT